MPDPRITIVDAVEQELEPRVALVIALLERHSSRSAPDLEPEAAAGAAAVLREAYESLHKTITDALPDPHGPDDVAAGAKPRGALNLAREHGDSAAGSAEARLVAEAREISLDEVMRRYPDPADLAAEVKRLVRLATEMWPGKWPGLEKSLLGPNGRSA